MPPFCGGWHLNDKNGFVPNYERAKLLWVRVLLRRAACDFDGEYGDMLDSAGHVSEEST